MEVGDPATFYNRGRQIELTANSETWILGTGLGHESCAFLAC